MPTRWHPDTCPGFQQGQGCIMDVDDWGPQGNTPTGTHVQRCILHSSPNVAKGGALPAVADVYADNLAAAKVATPINVGT